METLFLYIAMHWISFIISSDEQLIFKILGIKSFARWLVSLALVVVLVLEIELALEITLVLGK